MSQYGNYKVDLVELEKETKKLREKLTEKEEAIKKAKLKKLPTLKEAFESIYKIL
jgi:chromosome segregation ATPase